MITMLKLSELKLNNIPKKIDKELYKSIKEKGILEPILVRRNNYTIIDGVQRYLIAKKLGMKRIQCNIASMNDEQMKEYESMKPERHIKASAADAGKMVLRIKKQYDLTNKQVADKLGRHPSTIRRWIKAYLGQ